MIYTNRRLFLLSEEKSLDEISIIANPLYDVFKHSYKTLNNIIIR